MEADCLFPNTTGLTSHRHCSQKMSSYWHVINRVKMDNTTIISNNKENTVIPIVTYFTKNLEKLFLHIGLFISIEGTLRSFVPQTTRNVFRIYTNFLDATDITSISCKQLSICKTWACMSHDVPFMFQINTPVSYTHLIFKLNIRYESN